jgi:hypothetical protein
VPLSFRPFVLVVLLLVLPAALWAQSPASQPQVQTPESDADVMPQQTAPQLESQTPQSGADDTAQQTAPQSPPPAPAVQPNIVDPFGTGSLPATSLMQPMTVGQKLAYFEKPVFGPRTLFTTAFLAGISMANPPSGYPREWREGAAAFGRNYGNFYARDVAGATARFSADALLHEDPRYHRSTSKSFFGRTAHALAFTFVDQTDGGHTTLAVGNFAGAAASGFVGNAYLPNGWNDPTHAGQRALTTLGGYAAQNLAQEFSPEIGRFFEKLRLPKLPLPPVWWSKE